MEGGRTFSTRSSRRYSFAGRKRSATVPLVTRRCDVAGSLFESSENGYPRLEFHPPRRPAAPPGPPLARADRCPIRRQRRLFPQRELTDRIHRLLALRYPALLRDL